VGWGFSPLDEQLQVWDGHWSEGVAQQVVWLSGMVTFGEAAEILQRVGQIEVSKSSVWRRVERWGQVFKAVEDEAVAQANQLPARGKVVPGEKRGAGRMGAAIDGAMLYIRGEGWKELKVGCVFEVELQPTFDRELLDWEMLGHATHNSYVGYLGGPEGVGEKLWAEARRRGWTQAEETQTIGDGAVWIWNLVAQHFDDSRQVVDWYHGVEHLAQAADYLYGEATTPLKQRWLNEQKRTLFQGHAQTVGQTLRVKAQTQLGEAKEGLLQEAGYFDHNQRRMNYLELREEGWLIGSGMVESGAKQYKDRFTGPGMRWSRQGANRLIPIRSAIMSDRFDQVWPTVYNSPRN